MGGVKFNHNRWIGIWRDVGVGRVCVWSPESADPRQIWRILHKTKRLSGGKCCTAISCHPPRDELEWNKSSGESAVEVPPHSLSWVSLTETQTHLISKTTAVSSSQKMLDAVENQFRVQFISASSFSWIYMYIYSPLPYFMRFPQLYRITMRLQQDPCTVCQRYFGAILLLFPLFSSLNCVKRLRLKLLPGVRTAGLDFKFNFPLISSFRLWQWTFKRYPITPKRPFKLCIDKGDAESWLSEWVSECLCDCVFWPDQFFSRDWECRRSFVIKSVSFSTRDVLSLSLSVLCGCAGRSPLVMLWLVAIKWHTTLSLLQGNKFIHWMCVWDKCVDNCIKNMGLWLVTAAAAVLGGRWLLPSGCGGVVAMAVFSAPRSASPSGSCLRTRPQIPSNPAITPEPCSTTRSATYMPTSRSCWTICCEATTIACDRTLEVIVLSPADYPSPKLILSPVSKLIAVIGLSAAHLLQDHPPSSRWTLWCGVWAQSPRWTW